MLRSAVDRRFLWRRELGKRAPSMAATGVADRRIASEHGIHGLPLALVDYRGVSVKKPLYRAPVSARINLGHFIIVHDQSASA